MTEWLTVLTSQVNKRIGADIYIYIYVYIIYIEREIERV